MKIRNALFCLTLAGILLGCGPSDPRGLIVSKVQASAKLATVEYVLSKYIFGLKEKKIAFIKLSDAHFIAQTEARVKIGIDLNKLKPQDVEVNGESIRVQLPPVEILNFSYPPDKFQVDTVLTEGKLKIEDIETFSRLAEVEIRRDLHFVDIEENGQEKTRLFLSTLFKNMGFKEVILEFEPISLDQAKYFQESLNVLRKSLGDLNPTNN
ncbi:MAG: DUF4230 domain-containing protein [Bacteroidia bacterium]|nr:DUF4230 domain-containing protein [Bacteroidia bacterium]